jgi:lipoprotein-releasing system permease protein
MIENLYSEFDADITIVANKRKTFDEREIDWKKLAAIPEIKSTSKVIEEIVVLRHEKKWVNATLIGVEQNYLQTIDLKKHLWAGTSDFEDVNSGKSYGIIGVDLFKKLDGIMPTDGEQERLIIYAPKRNIKIRLGKNPFYTQAVYISGLMNYNKEVNEDKLLWSLGATRDLLNYTSELTHVYVQVKGDFTNDEVKQKIQKILNSNFTVKTNFEKNELIFQTSKSERVVVIIIMIFIFILASFNLIASLTMLYIEKKDNIKSLESLGLSKEGVFQIFFFEGLLISGIGILAGLFVGYFVCFLQLKFSLLVIPGPNIPFPINTSLSDFFLVFFSVSILSVLFSYFPTKILLKQKSF